MVISEKINYKGVIFDLDGTLLNTLADLSHAVNHVLTKHTLPIHKLDDYRNFVGDGARMLIIRSLPQSKRDENTVNVCLKEFLEVYERRSNEKTDLYPGIAELLDRLHDINIKLSVLSNKPHGLTVMCMNDYFSKWKFDVILGQQEGIPQKPDPAGALLIARKTGLPASSFLYIGDSGVDMKTAVSAGMLPVGALWGFRTAGELKDNGAKALLNHPLDLLTFIK